MNITNTKPGVTLIELIIVVIIVSVIATLAVSKVGSAGNSAKINALHITAKTLAAGIRQAEIAGKTSLIVSRNSTYGYFNGADSDYLTTSLGEDIEIWIEGTSEDPTTLELGSGGDDFILIHSEITDHDDDIAGTQIYLKFDRKGNYIESGTVATDYNTTFLQATENTDTN